MSNCRETAELLSEYVEGSLGPDDTARLRRHIGDCPPCEAFLRSFKVASEATRQMLMSSIPDDFHSKLTTFLRSRCHKG